MDSRLSRGVKGKSFAVLSLNGGLLDSVGPSFADSLMEYSLTLPSRNRPKIEASSPRAIPVETPTNKKTKKNRPSKKDRDKAKRKVARKAASEVESEGEIRSPSKRSPAQKASVRQSRRIAAQAARPSTAPTAQTSLQESLLQIYQARLPAHVTQPWHFSTNSPQSVNQPPTSPNGFQPSPALLLPNTFNWQPAMVEPRPQDKSDRDFQLRLRLIHCFPEDKKWLMAAVPFADHFHTPQETGIHVFVDFSNISIGYMQKVIQLRHEAHRRGEYLRMSQRLSFDSLVLLLERGRPVAKRVLAGSTPLDPAIAKAAAIGYDVKILQKVYKDDTVTERDRRAAALLSSPSPHELAQSSAGVTTTQTMALQTTSSSSPSPYSQPPSTPPSSLHPSPSHITPATGTANGRWVEQAVDEILHMTIYESVIDAETPSTIVLATGDGAQAEFSDGFMRTVERALNRGWRVELVAWKKAMNGSWKSGEWAGKWGDRFRILELDGWERWIEDVRV